MLLFLFLWLPLCVAVGILAGRYNRSAGGWFLLSLLLSPLIGFVFVLALGPLAPLQSKSELKGGSLPDGMQSRDSTQQYTRSAPPILDARTVPHIRQGSAVLVLAILSLVIVGGLVGQQLATRVPAPTITIAPAIVTAKASYEARGGWETVTVNADQSKAVRVEPTTKPAALRPSNVNKVVQDIGVGLTTAAQRRDYINETRVRVRNKMRDPSSVTFKDTFFSGTSGMPLTCGWVNGKNASGRYTGLKKFIATAGEKGIVLIDDGTKRYWILGEQLPNGGQQDIENSWNRFCVEKK